MGFGGGGDSGSLGVSAHTHDNSVGNGGTLKKESIITLNGTVIPLEAML